MIRKAFVMQVNPDAHKEYERRHSPVWPELEAVLKDGLPQTVDYARQCGADEAHLIVFDRRPDSPWDERIWQRDVTEQGRVLGVWGA